MRMVMGLLAHRRRRGALERPADDRAPTAAGSATCPRSAASTPSRRSSTSSSTSRSCPGCRPRDGARSAIEHLERFGLAERAKDHVEKLSLGNQQRVQIIAALLHRPGRPGPRRAVLAGSTRRPSTRWPTCCATTPRAGCRCCSPATSSTSSSGCATASSCWPAGRVVARDGRRAARRGPDPLPARRRWRRRLGARRARHPRPRRRRADRAARGPSTTGAEQALLAEATRRGGSASSAGSGRRWPRSTGR